MSKYREQYSKIPFCLGEGIEAICFVIQLICNVYLHKHIYQFSWPCDDYKCCIFFMQNITPTAWKYNRVSKENVHIDFLKISSMDIYQNRLFFMRSKFFDAEEGSLADEV